jgi:CRP/FNR family cyclic AMP-dependent transcriptional regulator
VRSAKGLANRLEHLHLVPGFRGCSIKQLKLVARLTDQLTVPSGTVLLREGSAGREAFVILWGTAAVTRGGDLVASLGNGDIFGELAALDPGPRDATVTATSELEVLVIGPREFAALVQNVPSFGSQLLVRLARRTRITNEPSVLATSSLPPGSIAPIRRFPTLAVTA